MKIKMDSFMDKLAQRLNAQEMIKANTAAEAAQTERLKQQVQAYEELLQEMRKQNLRSVENTDKLRDAAKYLEERLSALTEEGMAKLEAVKPDESGLEEIKKAVEGLHQALEDSGKSLKELLDASNDFNHKENVKVYRNVQAVVVEEIGKQTQALGEAGEKERRKSAAFLPLLIVTLVLSAVNTGILLVHLLGLL